MDLPLHVQTALSINSSITQEELAMHGAACQFASQAFRLSGEEFASAATTATAGDTAYSVEAAKRLSLSWKYLEITNDGVTECAGVCTPDNTGVDPSTAASQVLVGAWFLDSTLLDGYFISPKKFVRAMKTGLPAQSFSQRFLTEWAEICPLIEGHTVPPTWVSKNQLQLTSGSRILTASGRRFWFQDLFIEAASELKTKWRFLSLYRILEHGYLSEVFESLKLTFFNSPKESLASASTALESELNQFLTLVDSAGMGNVFESLHDKFDTMKSARNQFAVALDHSIKQSGQPKTVKSKSQKGVMICYKIRCAIVHAGISSPIFDAYTDGPACLEALLPICESAVLHFIGITAQ